MVEGVSLDSSEFIRESTLVSVQQSCDVTVCDADVVYKKTEIHFQFMSNKLNRYVQSSCACSNTSYSCFFFF